jgi:hypothetical protein
MNTIQEIIGELNALFENKELIINLKVVDTRVHLKEKIAEIDDEVQFLLAKLNLLLNKEKDIKKQYEILFLKYVAVFCEKHDTHYEYYINHDGIFIADTYISYADIRDDIDNDVPKECIWEYTEYCLENYHSKTTILNYEHWLLKEKNFKFKTKSKNE